MLWEPAAYASGGGSEDFWRMRHPGPPSNLQRKMASGGCLPLAV